MKEQNRVVSMRQLTPAETEVIKGGFIVTSSTPGNPQPIILCQPGFVFRCNKFGCFCVPA